MTVINIKDASRFTRKEYIERAIALRTKRGKRCDAKHFAFSTCKECGMEIPVGSYTEAEHKVYFEPLVISYAEPSMTSPEWRAEIFAATERYNAALAAYAAASDAWVAAALRERTLSRTTVVDAHGSPVRPDSAYVSRLEATTDASHDALDRAEAAVDTALRELNRISLPPRLRPAEGAPVEPRKRLLGLVTMK